ncbi:Uncharacterised protein [uncultured Blautia sp.]
MENLRRKEVMQELGVESAVAANISAPKMRVGYSPQKFAEMDAHDSPSINAEATKRPLKFDTLDAPIWFCVRQNVPKGTKSFKLDDYLDPLLKVDGISIQPSDKVVDYVNYFKVDKPKTNIGTRLTITAKKEAESLYVTKDLVLDFYIICSFDKSNSRLSTCKANGKYWSFGNKALVTVDNVRKNGNTSYIYGSSSLLSGTTEKAAMLYYRGGERLFGIEPDIAAGKATFPSVNLEVAGGVCVGWSKTDSTEDAYEKPEYVAGDKIPEAGKYYMAVYTQTDDLAVVNRPTELEEPAENTAVYFVGDSRTEHMGLTVGQHNEEEWLPTDKPVIAPDRVNIVAKSGQGLGWLHWEGLTKLKEALAVNKGKNHVVIMSLGVNDAAGVGGYEIYDNADYYVEYMRDSVYKPLKELYGDKIKFYYMSVNPLCSQALKDTVSPNNKVTEQNVVNFNKKIYDGLCSGSNKYFTYIDAYNELLLGNGWFSMIVSGKADDGIYYDGTQYDGIHYSNYTYIRIYNHCMKKIAG